jgi:hypothetical protein
MGLSRRQSSRLRLEASNENRKRRWWGNSVPQRHRCALDTTATAGVQPYDLKFMMTGVQGLGKTLYHSET